ncbi:protein S100-A10 isoform X1 [Struthio camelus]|uniref:protein S100-A10 isoform X1 n=1 Tax=Struthio camelus TaxID=8801 RepID=UPI003603FFCD
MACISPRPLPGPGFLSRNVPQGAGQGRTPGPPPGFAGRGWRWELPGWSSLAASGRSWRQPRAAMPSQMEHAMETLMFTFHKYAGDKNYLAKEDLRVLMEKEFPGFLENQKDPMALDKIMKDLDQCRDGKVGFQSFFSLVAGLTIACNDYFVVHMKQKGKK